MKKALLSILLLAGAVYLFGVWLPPASVSTASIAASAPVEAEPLADPSWQQVKEKGCLVIGVDDAFPPMTFLDESGQLTGLDIELAKEVCDALGIRAEFQPISWDEKEALLQDGSIDCIWSGLSITPERETKMCFSQPYLITKISVLSSTNVWIPYFSYLPYYRIGVQPSSAAWEMLNSVEDYEIFLPNVTPLETYAEGLESFAQGTLDTVIVDETYANYQAAQMPANYYLLPFDFGDDLYAVGFRLSDEALAQQVNDTLQAFIADGTAYEIAEKWLAAEKIIIP